MKRKILSMLLAVTMTFSLAACSGKGDSTTNEAGSTEVTTTEAARYQS